MNIYVLLLLIITGAAGFVLGVVATIKVDSKEKDK